MNINTSKSKWKRVHPQSVAYATCRAASYEYDLRHLEVWTRVSSQGKWAMLFVMVVGGRDFQGTSLLCRPMHICQTGKRQTIDPS